MQIIYFQSQELYLPFMTPKRIGFNFFANIMGGNYFFFIVQVVLALTLQATLKKKLC